MSVAKFIMLNGAVIPAQEARIHVLSPAITYAATVFEGIRAYWNPQDEQLYVFRLQEHLQRLQMSMRIMRYDNDISTDALHEQVLTLIRANCWREDIHIRVMAMVTGSPSILTSGPVTIAISASPFPTDPKAATGLALGVTSWRRSHDTCSPPRVKATANYSSGRLAMMEAKRHGHDMALMLSAEGKVSEAPVATLCMVRESYLVTPLATDGILESITRDTILHIGREEHGLKVAERQIDRTELYDAQEAFLCGSGWEIAPVATIDDIPLAGGSPGPVTTRLRESYLEIVRGQRTDSRSWLTHVWQ